jgi:hypothetical protein
MGLMRLFHSLCVSVAGLLAKVDEVFFSEKISAGILISKDRRLLGPPISAFGGNFERQFFANCNSMKVTNDDIADMAGIGS